jgi:regulator of RNase E activity RraA
MPHVDAAGFGGQQLGRQVKHAAAAGRTVIDGTGLCLRERDQLLDVLDLCDRFLDVPSGLQVVAPGLRSYGGRAACWGRIATVAPACPGGAVRLRDVLAEPGNGRVLVVEGHAGDRWAVSGL